MRDVIAEEVFRAITSSNGDKPLQTPGVSGALTPELTLGTLLRQKLGTEQTVYYTGRDLRFGTDNGNVVISETKPRTIFFSDKEYINDDYHDLLQIAINKEVSGFIVIKFPREKDRIVVYGEIKLF